MKDQEHVVAFAAHPDDEGAAWATLYKYFENKAKVSIVWSTYGDKFIAPVGKFVNYLPLLIEAFYSKKTRMKLSYRITSIRKPEAINAANLIKANPYFLEFEDQRVPTIYDEDALRKVTDLIRELKPTIVLTHWFREAHQDHKNTSALVFKSYRLSNDPDFVTNHPPHKVRIFGFWNERGKGYRPNLYLNVTNQIDKIKTWGKCHESQTFRIVGRFAKFIARRNAKKTPYRYVEAFKIYPKPRREQFREFFP